MTLDEADLLELRGLHGTRDFTTTLSCSDVVFVYLVDMLVTFPKDFSIHFIYSQGLMCCNSEDQTVS